MKMFPRQFIALTLIYSVIAGLTGCSLGAPPKPIPVTGRVAVNGKPLTKGLISFVPLAGESDEARPSTSVIQPDGTYKTSSFKDGDGLPAGRYKIVVTSDAQSLTAEEMAAGKKPVSMIPQIYTNSLTTPLTLEVIDDGTPIEHDVDLTDK